MTSEATHGPSGPHRADSPGADSPHSVDVRADVSGRVEVRIVSRDPEAARRVADALRVLFAGDEQRSYPDGPAGTGTRLHLTLDASHTAGPLRPWLDTSRPPADRTHRGETV
ncbi:hypothetical protein ACFVTC_24560 [Streptomyces sp. NPDC057950]|uniref:hypothetical protein n=1 Tax=Streptomyces sp. NPDC057950 TaxID=3346288 RepID=UPI0036EC2A98